jgi:hypothetical protein
MKRPVLSIVIPTLDRPDTLSVCLAALAKQPNPKVEIVIQDNASGEATAAVMKACNDSRIVRHRSSKRLSMRNNFEDGVAAARGDYIAIIGDDDAFCAGAIDWIVTMLEAHQPIALRWTLAAYYWPSLSDAQLGFFWLHPEKFYGGWLFKDARELTDRMLKGEMSGLWEGLQIYHGAVSRELYEETKAKTGGVFFQYQQPDVYVHTAMLLVAGQREPQRRRYIDVEHPLSIYGMSGHSNGTSWITAQTEDRGTESPIARWERFAAMDPHVAPPVQYAIPCVKYHDYVALRVAESLGLAANETIEHERWEAAVVAEVKACPWQYDGFVQAKPVVEFEKPIIARVIHELKHLGETPQPPPSRLQHVHDHCWVYNQLCLASAAPELPDDVDTAVDVLDRITDRKLGLLPSPALPDEMRKLLRGGMMLRLMQHFDANPPQLRKKAEASLVN